jgi:siderophore synthetase component
VAAPSLAEEEGVEEGSWLRWEAEELLAAVAQLLSAGAAFSATHATFSAGCRTCRFLRRSRTMERDREERGEGQRRRNGGVPDMFGPMWAHADSVTT